ncbi:MAG: hypothetical protein K5829_01420 [Treponema sp.]|nr:hypothetical protein [Treponema sp.]
MKNSKIKSIITILLVLCCCFIFSSFSPSLDGRAVVVEEGVFPQGLFAKTVGYLPGDIISVTNISGEKTVDILVIGALDPSEGVAIMLSPEAAKAIGIDKTNSNIVKITKRSGQDERVYGSAVIARQMNEFSETDDAEENTESSIPYISYEDELEANDNTAEIPTDAMQVSVSPDKNINTDTVTIIPPETSGVENALVTQPILTSSEISAIKGGVSDIDRKSLKEKTEVKDSTEENTESAEEEIYSAMNLSKEILDIPNAKSEKDEKVETVDNINLEEVSIDNTKNNSGFNAPQAVPVSENVVEVEDSDSTYEDVIYEETEEVVKEDPLPAEPISLDDLESVSSVSPDAYDEQEAIIGSYGTEKESTSVEMTELPPPFDEVKAQKNNTLLASSNEAEMYTANQPETEVPASVPFVEEEVALEPESEDKTEELISEEEVNINEESELPAENEELEESGSEEAFEEEVVEKDEGDNVELTPTEAAGEIEKPVEEAKEVEEEPLESEEVELDNLEDIVEEKEVVEEDSDLEPLSDEFAADEPEIEESSDELSEADEALSEEPYFEEEIFEEIDLPLEDEESAISEELPVESEAVVSEELPEEEEEIIYADEFEDEEDFVAEEIEEEQPEEFVAENDNEDELEEDSSEEDLVEEDFSEEDEYTAELPDFEEESEPLESVADLAEAPVEEEENKLFGDLEEVSEVFEDSPFFVEDKIVEKPLETEESLVETSVPEDISEEVSSEEIDDLAEIADSKELLIPEEVVEEFDDADTFEEEELPEDADYEEYSAITLVPVDENPPVLPEVVEAATESDEKIDNTTDSENVDISPVPVEKEDLENLVEVSETEETKNVLSTVDESVNKSEALNSYEKYIVNDSKDLTSGKYYIQIATITKDKNVLAIVNKYSDNYPIVIIPNKKGDKQILVGPLTMDEYATVLERFKSYGYKDAFLKKIK